MDALGPPLRTEKVELLLGCGDSAESDSSPGMDPFCPTSTWEWGRNPKFNSLRKASAGWKAEVHHPPPTCPTPCCSPSCLPRSLPNTHLIRTFFLPIDFGMEILT